MRDNVKHKKMNTATERESIENAKQFIDSDFIAEMKI